MDESTKYQDVMEDPGFKSSITANPTIIKVVGVGGGGNNAVNHMYLQGIKGVSFVVCNTDRQALLNSPVPNKLLIGPTTTEGLGAGNDPEVAKAAAEESENDISQLFDDETKMVFITAGMGGGTGTGAAPVVARIAREKGVLTIGIVTIPFLFEGNKKILKAIKGADEMSKYVDAILIINNERLTEIYPELDFLSAFGKADDTLSTAARSISDLINVKGMINLDFKDVNTTLRDGGVAIISSGYGEGERRVTSAIEDALNSPLLKNRDVYGSKKILMNFYFNPKSNKPFVMEEVNEMREFMCNFDPDVDVIWGTAFDETLEDKIKITILASGFNVTLSNEESKPAPKKPVATVTTTTVEEPQSSAQSDTDRIAAEYGATKLQLHELDMARARYVVLSNEDFENDELLEKIESTPTFRRDPKFKTTIKSMQSGTNPVTITSERVATQKPSNTISFE